MEYEYNEPVKKGHGGLALLFGILSIVLSLAVGFMFGMFGIVPAAILAILAIVLGVSSLRATNRSGKGGVITGIIGILFALLIGGMVMSIGTFLRSDEIKQKVPILAEYADDSWRGVLGIFMKMSSDKVDLDALTKQIDAFRAGEQTVVTTEAAD